MSELKAWADYSPAELLDALGRTEPRHVGDLYTDSEQYTVYRCEEEFHINPSGEADSLVCNAELLRVLVESIRLWQRVAADFGNALEGNYGVLRVVCGNIHPEANIVMEQAREALERYKHLQTEESNNAP